MNNKLSTPFHHLKSIFNYEAFSKKIKLNKNSYYPGLYHSNIINDNEKVFLRYYNAKINFEDENSGHHFFRNFMSKDYNDEEFMKKINQKIIHYDDNLNDDLNDLSLKEYINFITDYFKLDYKNEIIIYDDFKYFDELQNKRKNKKRIKIRKYFNDIKYYDDFYLHKYDDDLLKEIYNYFKNDDY